jgi:GNAT superfamily N-acetyltransferase
MLPAHLHTLSQTTISLLHPRDLAQTAALFHYVVAQLPYYNEAAKRAALAKYAAPALQGMIGAEQAAVLTARHGGQTIGFAISRQDEGTVWLAWYGVHPHWRGHGVGGALLDAVEARTRAQGIHKIWCACRTENHPARHTLHKAGFEEICTLVNHWHGQDYVLLQELVQ